ncbi:dCTP deaminase [Domibacillus indicus]|uniref:dCTP deaminase n=1 Tax=Domibacillus indicus TaxID=1437523 RepID=UPI002040A93C|nr:dCTP deaminase [Domibacillus indicus]MCM3791452.1 dCTP deaminase [Domibacillus indicus]
MFLSNKTIIKKLREKELLIEPYTPSQIQPASIDLRMGNHFKIIDESSTPFISLEKPASYKEVCQETIIIPPQGFVLGITIESIHLPGDLTAFLEGRRSIGRLGLFIQNAGWINPGYKGQITLELYNANRVPIELKAGRRVCQLALASLDQKADGYIGKYNDQESVTESQLYLDTSTTKMKFKEFD